MEGKKLLEISHKKNLWLENTLHSDNRKKITYSTCRCKTEIDFAFVAKKDRNNVRNVLLE